MTKKQFPVILSVSEESNCRLQMLLRQLTDSMTKKTSAARMFQERYNKSIKLLLALEYSMPDEANICYNFDTDSR